MKNKTQHWTKLELKTYILLLCANSDADETTEELELIKAKIGEDNFSKVYEEFSQDSEDESLDKIQDAVALHNYSHKELVELRSEMKDIFLADKKFMLKEKNLERILRNILY